MAAAALFCLLLYSLPLSSSDIISLGRPLTGNETIVSKGGRFELGFFSPGGGASPNFYLGIWYFNISQKTVVWVANRELPLSSPSDSELKISESGTIILTTKRAKNPIWASSNPSRGTTNTTVAVLLDTGNFILRDASDVIWQSFDHPTDTALPGAKVGHNRTSGRSWTLTSWKSPEDPSPGNYTLTIDPNGGEQFIMLWNGKNRYWASGLWDGRIFANIPEMNGLHQYGIYRNSSGGADYYWYVDHNYGVSGMVMSVTGQLHWQEWVFQQQNWLVFTYLPKDPCAVYFGCGSFAACMPSDPPCRCLPGFQPRHPADWASGVRIGGCVRKTELTCGTNDSVNKDKGIDRFLKITAIIDLPTNSTSLVAADEEECATACANDCSCTAYSYNDKCLVWRGELGNLKQSSNVEDGTKVLSLRLAATDVHDSGGSHKSKNYVAPIVGVIVGITLLAVAALVALAWRRKKRKRALTGFPVLYKYRDLQTATKNFSEALGRGGFGSVYKGVLPDKSIVAVKKLEGLGQGDKQFRAEVAAMAAVQHINVVQLRGFCCYESERLLVYDFHPNRSLDNYLLPRSSRKLDWCTRFQIALGIARGLTYLHEKCRECIIHCDVKPENILLDEDFSPKVADFGMAKLVGRDFSRVLTTLRGTVGYLAPEWISGDPITTKADVYSYGMMLFEIVSGRRNMDKGDEESSSFFPMWASRSVAIGEGGDWEENAGREVDVGEFRRACRVACWCVQDEERGRPTMGEVVQMLEGVAERGAPLIPRNLRNLVPTEDSMLIKLSLYSLLDE